jgi:hypothetical protein
MMVDSVLRYTYYWGTDRKALPQKMTPVLVVGYREVTSMEHLRHKQCCAIPYAMLQKYKSYAVYDPVPHCSMQEDIDMDAQMAETYTHRDKLFDVAGEPITMTEFFKLIGYDYKTKKFNGLTMRQMIAKHMKGVGK